MFRSANNHRSWRRHAVVLSVSLTLVAAACGSDQDSTDTSAAPAGTTASSGTASSETTSPSTGGTDTTDGESDTTIDGASIDPASITNGRGVTDTEVRIGMVIDQSGPFGALTKDIETAFNAKIALINDNGGIAGRQIRVITTDTKSDAATNLQAFKRMWEQEEVLGIYTLDFPGPPLDYVKDNNIPLTSLGGSPGLFSSEYPSIVPSGSFSSAWNLQTAYSVIHFQEKQPKVVAYTYNPATEEPMLDWIEAGFKTLGVEEVLFDPYPDPTAPCDSLVVKYKDAEVDMWIQSGNEFLSCIPAQQALGWSPPMGQGGPGSSSLQQASLIGKPMADLQVFGGSPGLRADGSPTFTTPDPVHIEYQETMAKYAPEFVETKDLNDWVPMSAYVAAMWFEDGLTAAALTGEISPEALLEWAHNVEDWDPKLTSPVRSMAPDCKTGNDATIWGTWVWDEATQSLSIDYFAPLPGEPMVQTLDFLDEDPCFLTRLADELFVN